MTFEEFWRFSLDRYARPGVAELCLDLQGRHGADVNIILLALWCGQASIWLDPGTLERIVESGPRNWHETVVRPLRAARRAMKSPPRNLGAGMVEPVCQRLKAIEIECEKLEQHLLFAALTRVKAENVCEVGTESPQTVAAGNVRNYLTELSATGADTIADVAEKAARLCID